jgi:hypothetical protein
MGKDIDFCDLYCQYAEFPKDAAIDGAGSCRTFVGLYCTLKKSLVPKNKMCGSKKERESITPGDAKP